MYVDNILQKVQLHVSALDSVHLQVVHEIFSKQLYGTYIVYSGEVGGEVVMRSRMCHGGWEVWVHVVSTIICISELIIVKSVVSYYVCCRYTYNSRYPMYPHLPTSMTQGDLMST